MALPENFQPVEIPEVTTEIEEMIHKGIEDFNSRCFSDFCESVHPNKFSAFPVSQHKKLVSITKKAMIDLLIKIIPLDRSIKYSDPIDLKVWTHGETSFATFLLKREIGKTRWQTIRVTHVYYQFNGLWQLVHLHESILM